MSEGTPESKKKGGSGLTPGGGGRAKASRNLSVREKAQAVALWREGTVTLDDLAKRFKRRPETFSRLFKAMGVAKGSGAAEALKKAEEATTRHIVSDVEETLRRIAQVKDSHFKMTQRVSFLAFQEMQNAKKAEVDVAKLKETMMTYKILNEILATSRKELFEILNVEKHDAASELDDLPDLTVRELTANEVDELRNASGDDGLDDDMGDDMLDLEDDLEDGL